MPKYKNVSEDTLTLPGIGEVKPGETVEAEEGFNNANFEKVVEVDREPRRKRGDEELETKE